MVLAISRCYFVENIILWNVDGIDRHKSNKARCPLLYFFPLLLEWVSLSRGDASTTRDLLRHCFLNVLDSITIYSWSEQRKGLINLLWLIKRQNQSDGVGDEMKVSSAVALLLPRFVALLPTLVEEKELKVNIFKVV